MEGFGGNPGPNLRSGNALVVMAAQAIVFNSRLEHSYVMAIETVGTLTMKFLKTFAARPMFASIVGKYKQAYLKEFTADELTNIDRVTVKKRNPLVDTTAGRLQMAESMLQQGIITTMDQYLIVMETGSLDPMLEPTIVEMLLIQSENEDLALGKPVIGVPTDTHTKHIIHHKAVLANIEARKQADVIQATLDHIQWHIDISRTMDPHFLTLTGNQPLPPPELPPQGGNAPSELQAPQTTTEITPGGKMPNLPEGADQLTTSAYEKVQAMSQPQA